MKRIVFLAVVFVLMIALSACGAEIRPQDGLTAAMGASQSETAVLVNNEVYDANILDFQCSGVFQPGSADARINFQLTTDNEALGGDTAVLYGAGSIVIGESDMGFDEAQTFTCQGSGQLRAYKTSDTGSASLANWLLELQLDSLTAQIDGVMTPLSDGTGVGLAVWPGQEPAVLTQNENISELKTFQCQGTMIPNGGQAAITFTAETVNGQKITGGGILETGEHTETGSNSEEIECSMQDKGWVSAIFEPNDANYMLGQTYLNLTVPNLQIRNSSGQQRIMFETFMTAVVITD